MGRVSEPANVGRVAPVRAAASILPLAPTAAVGSVAAMADLLAERFTAPTAEAPPAPIPPLSQALALLRERQRMDPSEDDSTAEDADNASASETPAKQAATRQLQLARKVYSGGGEPPRGLSIVG